MYQQGIAMRRTNAMSLGIEPLQRGTHDGVLVFPLPPSQIGHEVDELRAHLLFLSLSLSLYPYTEAKESSFS